MCGLPARGRVGWFGICLLGRIALLATSLSLHSVGRGKSACSEGWWPPNVSPAATNVHQLAATLKTGLHAYRHLGPRQGTIAVVRRATRGGRGRIRAWRLRGAPLRVSSDELRRALGDRTGQDSLLAASEALPSLARWVESLQSVTDGERTELLRRADNVVCHRFDLLGSGPTELGPTIDWHRDFKIRAPLAS